MHYSKYANRSSSRSSTDTSNRKSTNKLKSHGAPDFEYVGRLVTRERPIIQKSKFVQQNHVFHQNKHKYHHSMAVQHQEPNEEVSGSSSGEESDGLSKPLGVIRISDRHLREIYRLPTPPPKVKRVYHRLRSPEPKVIERVFVRRPPPQIIENIIEVPPEKVRIVTREKYLEKPPPITRSKLVHLKSRHRHREGEEEEAGEEQFEQEQQQQQTYIPSQQYSQQQQSYIPSQQYSQQQQSYIPSQQYPQQQQTYIPSQQYPQQQSYMPSQQYFQQQQQQPTTGAPLIATQPVTTTTTTKLPYPPQGSMCTVGYMQSTPYTSPPQQTTTYQMAPPSSYHYPHQHQPIPNSPYGYAQY